MKPKGRLKKGCLLTAIVCVVLYLGLLITLRLTQPPVAPITWQVDLPNGKLAWSMHPLPSGNLACVTGKVIYFISPSGEIIQKHDPVGERVWYGDTDDSGNLYVGGSDGYVFPYDPDGKERWAVQLPDRSIAKPLYARLVRCKVDESGNVIAQISSGELAVLSPIGEVLHHAAFPFKLRTTQAPSRVAEDRFAVIKYLGSQPDELTVVDLSGNEIWSMTQGIYGLTNLVEFEDVLVLNIGQDEINGISLDGKILWSFVNPDPVPAFGGHKYQVSSVPGDAIYVSTGKHLFALDRDANTLWHLTNQGLSHPKIDNNNRLLFVENSLPAFENLRMLISRQTIRYGTSLGRGDYPSRLVEVVDQHITQRWQVPDNFILGGASGSEFGLDGEVYGHTMADSKKNIPLTIYRIDL